VSFPGAPDESIAGGCGRHRLKFSRLSFPADKATSQVSGSPSVFSTRYFQTAACSASFGFVWLRNCTSLNFTSFREHFSHNENSRIRAARPRQETPIPRWSALDRNGLGGLFYSRANKQSTRPDCLGVIPSWLLSSCLIVCSSRSVRIPVDRDVRLRYLQGNPKLYFCQALFFKTLIFGQFFA